MRVTLLTILALCALCYGQISSPYFGYSGNWDTAGTMPFPSSSGSSCSLSDSYPYAVFNVTFTSNGVRRFSTLSSYYVFVYTAGTFNASNGCSAPFVYITNQGYGGVYSIDSYNYYLAGTYTFVLISDYSTGDFTGQITQGTQGMTTNSSGNQWNPIYPDSSGTCTLSSSSDLPYYQITAFTVPSTGYYDIEAYFSRDSNNDYPSYTYLTVFNNYPNASVQTNACGGVGNNVSLVAVTYGYYQYAEAVQIMLNANYTYYILVSANDDTFWGPYAFEVVTTRRFNFTLPSGSTSTMTGGFTEPQRGSDYYGSACQTGDSGHTNQPYAAVTFNIPSGWNFSIELTQPGQDYEFFMYVGSIANIPPSACPLLSSYVYYGDSIEDTFDPSNNVVTVIADPYYTGSSATNQWYTDVYVTTGAPLTPTGSVVVTTTTTTTTTTAPVTTTTTTTRSPVTTTTTTTTPVTTTTTTTRSPNATTTTSTTKSPVTTTTTTTRSPVVTTTSAASVGASVAGVAALVAALFSLIM